MNKIDRLLGSEDSSDVLLGLQLLFNKPEIQFICKGLTIEENFMRNTILGNNSNLIYRLPEKLYFKKYYVFSYNNEAYKCYQYRIFKSIFKINDIYGAINLGIIY